MSVTMRDVALEAGVSIKTVSRVVNDQAEISDLTRQRVLSAIEALGYRPSKVARALVTNRTDTISLIVGDIANPFFSDVARGVLDIAQKDAYDVFLCNTDGSPEAERKALYSLIDHDVDGAIIFPTHFNHDWLLGFFHPDRPVVLVNIDIEPRPGLGIIRSDLRKGARLAVDYLIEKGHRKIGMVVGQSGPDGSIRRVLGYQDSLVSHGLEFRQELLAVGMPVFEHGYAGARKILTEHPEVTALFCYNDLIAMGALRACKDLRKRVPRDCAIIGFDNNRFSALTDPALTTVHIDKYEIGKQAACRLLDMLKEPTLTFPAIHFDAELIVRESA